MDALRISDMIAGDAHFEQAGMEFVRIC